ncbi:MAG: alkaline phosphatase family protein [Candidatus Nanohaloarchaea archaeon]
MTLLVFGMDGAVREYVEEAIDRGLMPNLEKFMEEGSFGELESTTPPVTIPAWVSMFSGLQPDKFDTFHMTAMDRDYNVGVNQSRKWRGRMAWDRLEGSFGVINVPGTSPVWELDGFMLEGFPMVEDPDCYPSELLEELPEMEFENVREKPTREGRRKALFKNFDRRKKAFAELDRDSDVRIEVYQLTDTMAHKSDSLDEVLEAYEKVDEVLGDRMEQYDNVLLVSDHGFTHVDRYFYINTWLEKNGFLARKQSNTGKRTVQKLLGPLAETPLRPVLKKLNDIISSETGVDFSPKSGALDEIDFEKTEAFSYLRGTANYADININDSRWASGPVENREEVAERVKEEMEKEEFVEEVMLREEIYDEPENMPDLIVKTDENTAIGPPLFSKTLFRTNAFVHSKVGIYGTYGPAFRSGELEDADIVDVAPTLAKYLGQELDVDGSPLDVFAEDFESRTVSDVSGIEF